MWNCGKFAMVRVFTSMCNVCVTSVVVVAQPRLRDEMGACHVTVEKVLEDVVWMKAQIRRMAARY